MGTKNNPGNYDCYAKLEPNEPYFLLRGKDPVGWLLVNLWASIRKHLAPHGEIPPEYLAKLNEAKICGDAMKAYAEKHPSNVGTRAIDRVVQVYNLIR